MRTAVETDDVRETGTMVGGNQLRYLTAGEGHRPILLLHGGIIDAAHVSWGGIVGPLSEDRRVIAPDLLGYGWSDKPEGPYSQTRHARTINTFLDMLDVDEVDIVGTSMGAGIGIDLALRSPDRVRRLVAADSYGLGTELPDGKLTFLRARLSFMNKVSLGLLRRRRDLTKLSLEGIVTDVDALDEAVVDAIYELLQIDGIGRAYRSWRSYEVGPGGFRTHYYTDLDELSIPVLYIHGEHDEVFPIEWSERAAEVTPDGSFERFEDCAHWVPRESPERFLESVRSFLT
jgi:pimeloyl-ACP methyl ester carboxylesterase